MQYGHLSRSDMFRQRSLRAFVGTESGRRSPCRESLPGSLRGSGVEHSGAGCSLEVTLRAFVEEESYLASKPQVLLVRTRGDEAAQRARLRPPKTSVRGLPSPLVRPWPRFFATTWSDRPRHFPHLQPHARDIPDQQRELSANRIWKSCGFRKFLAGAEARGSGLRGWSGREGHGVRVGAALLGGSHFRLFRVSGG
jgi:hypothetical protein